MHVAVSGFHMHTESPNLGAYACMYNEHSTDWVVLPTPILFFYLDDFIFMQISPFFLNFLLGVAATFY